jgi:hypothetical protein
MEGMMIVKVILSYKEERMKPQKKRRAKGTLQSKESVKRVRRRSKSKEA